MKILQVNCVYRTGSTGKITYDLHAGLLQNNIESIVCYGRGVSWDEYNVIRVCTDTYARFNKILSKITGIMYGGCFVSTRNLIKVIQNEQPDIIHLQCINGTFVNIYNLIRWLKEHKQKTVLTLHAEFMYTANCGYALSCEQWKTGCKHCEKYKDVTGSLILNRTRMSWKKMKKAFEGFDNIVVTAVSPWLKERAEKSAILSGKSFEVVMNGLDTTVFRVYSEKEVMFFIKKYELEGKKIVFHASPNFRNDKTHIKGGFYVIEMARRNPEIIFIVAGPVEKEFECPKNMILIGHLSDQFELAKWYSLSNITLLTSMRETFSMVVAESLCCGTFVVGFEAGGPESISIKEYSIFVTHGDIKSLECAIRNNVNRNHNKEEIARSAKKKYSSDIMVKNYMMVYDKLTDE